jgi:hypothetical protein
MASKKLNQIVLAVIISVLVTFLVSFLILKYIPENNQNIKVNDYKKEIYTSTLCQYRCPLSLQQSGNKTGYLPEPACIQNCTSKFKASQLISDDISNNQMKKDALIDDMSNAITACKNKALDTKVMALNNTLFFSCSIEKLDELRSKYDYLS